MKRLAVCAIAAASVALFAAAFATGKAAPTSRVTLKPCHVEGVKEEVRCGVYQVFENRKTRKGRMLPLKIVVIPARHPHPEDGPIFYLAGGPGETATEMGELVVASGDAENHDVVLVDERGTGEGRSSRLPRDWIGRRPRRLSQRTLRPSGRARLPRRARSQIRPHAIQHAQLRGRPRRSARRAGLREDQPERRLLRDLCRPHVYAALSRAGAHRVLQQSRPACEPRAALPRRGGAARAERTLQGMRRRRRLPCRLPTLARKLHGADETTARCARAHHRPASGHRRADGDSLERTRLWRCSSRHDVSRPSAHEIPFLLEQATAGDFRPIAAAALRSNRGIYTGARLGLHYAITCNEFVSRIRPEDVEPATRGSFLGAWRVRDQMAACRDWPKTELPAGYFEPFRLDTPALLVSGEADATGSNGRWGKEVASFMPNAVHVIVPGAGHTPDNECVSAIRHAMFRSGTTKNLDPSCIGKLSRPAFKTPTR